MNNPIDLLSETEESDVESEPPPDGAAAAAAPTPFEPDSGFGGSQSEVSQPAPSCQQDARPQEDVIPQGSGDHIPESEQLLHSPRTMPSGEVLSTPDTSDTELEDEM